MKKEIPELKRLELNEQNVIQTLYECRATAQSKNTKYTSFFDDSSKRKAPPFHFDIDKVYRKSEIIRYLLGQVHCYHTQKEETTPAEGIFNYKKEKWTDNNNALFALYYLGTGCNAISKFIDGEKTAVSRKLPIFYRAGLKPTFSPSDPRFKLEDARLALKQLGVEIDGPTHID